MNEQPRAVQPEPGEAPSARKPVRGGLRIAAVIPVRNRPRLVVQALETVRLQVRPPDVLVVVDDGSTDHTPQQVQDWLARHGREGWQLLALAHAGHAAARNAGLAAAGSVDAVAFLDSDDLWPIDFLARAEAALMAEPSLVAVSADREFHDVQSGRRWCESLAPLAREPLAWIVRHDGGIVSCTLLRAAQVRAAGGFPPYLITGPDLRLFFPLAARYRWGHVAGKPVILRRGHTRTFNEAPHVREGVTHVQLRWAVQYEKLVRRFAPAMVDNRDVRRGMYRRWLHAAMECVRDGRRSRALSCLRRARQWDWPGLRYCRCLAQAWMLPQPPVRAPGVRPA